jgi:hypothetical protein
VFYWRRNPARLQPAGVVPAGRRVFLAAYAACAVFVAAILVGVGI